MSKRKKLKLPKRIAGVKIPKAARKGPVADFINSSGGQVLLAEALVPAAGVFGVRRLETSTGDSAQDIRENLAEASARLSYACSQARKAFRAALAEPAPDVANASAEPDETQSDELPNTTAGEEIDNAIKKSAAPRGRQRIPRLTDHPP